ncbi:hypothetical protein C7H84_02755 [Burkholderia sp. Nafp2/4-1b]|nr:hypothetical protein C7H84_02755 [Burkholderia sp. Nafp2/4-1b]
MNLELNRVRVLRHAQSKYVGFGCRRAGAAIGGTLRARAPAASPDAGVNVVRDTAFGCGRRWRDAAAPIGTVQRRGRRADGKVYRRSVRNGMTDT